MNYMLMLFEENRSNLAQSGAVFLALYLYFCDQELCKMCNSKWKGIKNNFTFQEYFKVYEVNLIYLRVHLIGT